MSQRDSSLAHHSRGWRIDSRAADIHDAGLARVVGVASYGARRGQRAVRRVRRAFYVARRGEGARRCKLSVATKFKARDYRAVWHRRLLPL